MSIQWTSEIPWLGLDSKEEQPGRRTVSAVI